MRTIQTGTDLRAAILELEIQQAEQAVILKKEFHEAYESIKPINLIKNTFKDISHSGEVTDHLVSTGVGMVAGYISRKVFQQKSHGLFRRLLGKALQLGITSYIASHPEAVKAVGRGVMEIINKITESGDEDEERQYAYQDDDGEDFS